MGGGVIFSLPCCSPTPVELRVQMGGTKKAFGRVAHTGCYKKIYTGKKLFIEKIGIFYFLLLGNPIN